VSETAESAPAASAAGGNGPKKRALFQRKGNSKAAVRSREQQQAEDAIPWGIIKPNLTAKKRWDGLIATLILYSIIAVPLRIGFGVCMPLFSIEFYLDLCVDACFLLDIALCFRTAIFTIDKADETAQEQKLETDYTQIAKDYLKGWFLIDVASSVRSTPLCLSPSTGRPSSLSRRRTRRPCPPACLSPFSIGWTLGAAGRRTPAPTS